MSRFKETSDQEEIQQADARVISRADVPVAPSFPKKTYSVVLAGATSIVLGLLLVFLLDRLDSGVRNPEEIEQLTGISAMGIVPQAPGLTKRGQMGGFVLDKPSSGIAEAIIGKRGGFQELLRKQLDPTEVTRRIQVATTGEAAKEQAIIAEQKLFRFRQKNEEQILREVKTFLEKEQEAGRISFLGRIFAQEVTLP